MSINTSLVPLPKPLLAGADSLAKKLKKTRTEIIREALRRYILNEEWQILIAYGKAHAKAQGIKPSEINRIIKDYRLEQTKVKR